MKRFLSWQMTFALILIVLSVVFYFIHYFIFRDVHHIFLYLIGDIGFLFLDVLIVMLVLHRLLEHREKQSILKKLNMVIGTFFSEVGTEFLKKCSLFDPEMADMGRQLVIKKDWTDKDFLKASKSIQGHKSEIDSRKGNLHEVKDFLVGKRQFLLNLLENPNLLEHESFTDLLWAVFHLTDELAHRKDLNKLPDTDYQHLSGDIKRAYQKLIVQWLDYMKHLKKDYPYLFSLSMRTNPFDSNASVEVK
ncbi:MAG: hypothetical protein JW928_07380 [Candidatus Aureabacteria bacterium]|nr:hypothetical protein [Candidatus Auribacterota bacterium]